jgi:hypothetical protein
MSIYYLDTAVAGRDDIDAVGGGGDYAIQDLCCCTYGAFRE